MASDHTAKAFDEDLQEIARFVSEMGGLVERMITDSVDALIRRDVALGKRVVASDVEVDSLQRVIEERAVLTIARRQPMAIDLREIVGAMRVVSPNSTSSPRYMKAVKSETRAACCMLWVTMAIV